jgi:hypothetical protein
LILEGEPVISTSWNAFVLRTVRTDRRDTRDRRCCPRIEPLERRAVPTLGFGTAFAIPGSQTAVAQVALGTAGNRNVTGQFSGSVNFDPAGSAAGVRNSGLSANSAYVAKYSPSGALVWVDAFTAPSGLGGAGSQAAGVAVDSVTTKPLSLTASGLVGANGAPLTTVTTAL